MPKFRQNKWFSFNQLRISLGFGGLTRVLGRHGPEGPLPCDFIHWPEGQCFYPEVLRTSSCWARKDISFPTLCFAKDGASLFLAHSEVKTGLVLLRMTSI